MADCKSLISRICGMGRGLIFPHDDGCKSIRFEGIEDVYIYEGDDIDLTCGVHAYDADGNEVEYTAEPSEIPSGKSGVFDITYKAVGAETVLMPNVCGTNRLHASAYCADRKVTAHRKVLVRNKLCVSTVCNFILDCGTKGYVPYDCGDAPDTYRTVLYSDGTLIINERDADRSVNEAVHGTVTNEYVAFDPYGTTDIEKYIFTALAYVPWYAQRNTIKAVEIGSNMSPTSTALWFANLRQCTSIGLSGLDTSKVTDMNNMFSACALLTSVDVSDFDTSNVTNMASMFRQCSALTELDLSNFSTDKLTNTAYMFGNCSALASVDLSSFKTNRVTRMNYMFNSCTALETIYVTNNFVTTQVTRSEEMFDNMSTNLVGGAGTTWNENNPQDKTYAHIDGGTSNPGYFTAKE